MESKPRILIFGDVMLDYYVSGKVNRISPEAPVPVVQVNKEWSALGGAANVAANVASLGATPELIGLIGADVYGQQLVDSCNDSGIECSLIQGDQPTIVKTRVVSGQQIVRFDREEKLVWTDEQFKKLTAQLEKSIADSSLVLLSDYAKGTLSDVVLELVFKLAKQHNKNVLVDPKRADWSKYSGAFLVSPNLKELEMANQEKEITNDDNEVVQICNELRIKFNVEYVVATRSSYGMTLVGNKSLLNIPTRALEVYDVSGAGDTVLAAFGVGLAVGKTVSESAFIANAAAGIVVSKQGTAVVKRFELDAFLNSSSKEVSRHKIVELTTKIKDRKVVFTNGCFDVLHQGHRKLLTDAKALGDYLIVGLNSDESISRLKGSERPINKLQNRIEALTALPSVNAVIVFGEDTPAELLEELQPNILVKGGDYKPEEIVGRNLVEEVIVVPFLEGFSTTNLMQ